MWTPRRNIKVAIVRDDGKSKCAGIAVNSIVRAVKKVRGSVEALAGLSDPAVYTSVTDEVAQADLAISIPSTETVHANNLRQAWRKKYPGGPLIRINLARGASVPFNVENAKRGEQSAVFSIYGEVNVFIDRQSINSAFGWQANQYGVDLKPEGECLKTLWSESLFDMLGGYNFRPAPTSFNLKYRGREDYVNIGEDLRIAFLNILYGERAPISAEVLRQRYRGVLMEGTWKRLP